MSHPPRHLIWIQLALIAAVVVVPIKHTNRSSSPANNPRQSIALEVLFQLAANTKVDRQAVLTFNLLSNDISVLAVSIMTIATLHLYFLGNSPYLSFDLKGFFSKLAKKQTNGTIVSKEFFLDEVAKTSESMIDKDL